MNRFQSFLNSAANLIWGYSAKRPSEELLRNVKIVAHRGTHENAIARENSREAFRHSIENQIWGVEFDIRWTMDNVAVIHHDEASIAVTTFADLKKFDPELMTLEEAIQMCSQKIVMFIELKESLKGNQVRIDRLEKLLSRLIPRKHFYLLALDPQILESIPFVSKKAMMDVAFLNLQSTLDQSIQLGHGGVSGPFALFTDSRLKIAREKGLLVGTGFIEDRGTLYREVSRGIDLIFTNHPLRLKSFLQNP